MENQDYTLFNATTGRMIQIGFGYLPEMPDTIRVPGHCPDGSYIDMVGEVKTLPASPGDWAVFDRESETWTDPRTEADHQAALEAKRLAASMTRIEFLLAATVAGIISQTDAIAAAKGEIPPAMAGLISALTPQEQFEAAVKWGAATRIERSDPFINGWAVVLGVSDAELDAMFGVQEVQP